MSLHSKGSKAAIKHSANVLSEQHLKDKAAFKENAQEQPVVILLHGLFPVPEAHFNQPLRNEWGEPQRAFLRVDDNFVEVPGNELTERMLEEAGKRGFKYMGNGKNRRPAKRKNNEPLRIEVIPLSSWHSELINSHGAAILDKLAWEIGLACERLTGRKVLGLCWHLDTSNYHLDILSTDINDLLVPYPSVIGKTGAWLFSAGAAIDLRYADEGFPVDPDILASEKNNEKRERSKKGCTSLRNLDLGLFADRWIRNWAATKGLEAIRLKFRARYEEAARARIAAVARLKSADEQLAKLKVALAAATNDLSAARSELEQLKDTAARLMEKRIAQAHATIDEKAKAIRQKT